MGIKNLILIQYWYLVGMSRRENLCISELLFESILSHIDTRAIMLGVKVNMATLFGGEVWDLCCELVQAKKLR